MTTTDIPMQLHCRKCGAHHNGYDYLARVRENESTYEALWCSFTQYGCEALGLKHSD